MTGAIAAREEQQRLISDRLPLVELLTVLVVLLAVGLHYRAVVAPLVTLAAVAVTYLVSIRVVAWFALRFGVSVPNEVQPVIVVLLFGIPPTTPSSSSRASGCGCRKGSRPHRPRSARRRS